MRLTDARAHLRRIPPSWIDLALVAAVAAAMTLTISVGAEGEAGRPADVYAYALGLLIAALVLARRHWAMGVLVGSVGVLVVYYSLGYPSFPPAVPLAVATYFAARAGQTVKAGTLLAGFLVFGAGWRTIEEHKSLASVLGTGTLPDVALLAAVLFLGEAVRSRRAWADEVRQRLQRAEQDREREATQRAEQERLRVARELHDVVSHTIAALNIQAAIALDTIDDAPDQAKNSLRAIREQSRSAIAELRGAVGLLRSGAPDAPRTPAPRLADLEPLLRIAHDAGVRVDVSTIGGPRPLGGAVDLTAYRIVQEALTNVIRHADASRASVTICYEPQALVLEIDDDGRGAAAGGHGADGYGITGMTERVEALAGTLHAAPGEHGGFRVHARLPTP